MTNKLKRLILIISGIIIVALIIIVFTKPVTSQTDQIKDQNVTLENGVQIVHMRETASGYLPNSFTIVRGIPVKWIVTVEETHSCASVLLVPKFKIREFLKAGENTLEFTPTETGSIPFSCSMGMFTGTFNVIK